ncbi:uncharacterized protein BDW47DRAFT_123544 [Aspergillus candidus]|uniref:Uncharacterized protein n=1 Tax=Aspergillus candidus TaxID=41067 RepID=A0A2I2FIU2_ASPCN|nr:hypothetical protein BDW47DRAFT_123544 [Aspergillus candidus]PLB40529.1 hypothetical protein BDW47DRAFT_123544 [Aspergillus candidus]
MLKKVPAQFVNGIYEDGGHEQSSSSSSSTSSSRVNFTEATQSETPTLPKTLTDEFKLLLSHLIHIHHLYPPGDQIPFQEVYLISQHGPKLHLLWGIFPSHKTSRLWSGRYNQASPASSTGAGTASPTHHFAATNTPESRYYAGPKMERVRQERMALCCAAGDEEESDARTFRVRGSREFDL